MSIASLFQKAWSVVNYKENSIKESTNERLNHLPKYHSNRGSLFLATKAMEIANERDNEIKDVEKQFQSNPMKFLKEYDELKERIELENFNPSDRHYA